MVDELVKISRTPSTPLEILQVELEAVIQVVAHTLFLYGRCYVRLPKGKLVPIADLGYEGPLCNMALVNAAAAWDGFKRNMVRIIKANGRTFSERKLDTHVKQATGNRDILEPLARRDCIVHNFARADSEYKKRVPKSPLAVGASLDINLPYLKDASAALFYTAVETVKSLVCAKLLAGEQQKTLGEFQRDPIF